MSTPDAAGFSAACASAAFAVDGPDLIVSGVPARALAEEYGTPLYVYDAGAIRRAYRALAGALEGFAEVVYSIKANPNPAIAAILVGEGAGVEVASAGEFRLALRAGADPARILAAGPGKTRAELAELVAGGIGEIHLESAFEIDALDTVAAEAGRVQAVSIRVNPVAAAGGGAMRMGGKPTAFGFDEEDLEAVVRAVEARANLALGGVHMFAGTQILDADVLAVQWRHGLAIASRVAALVGRPLAAIDLGGGLGIPYHPGDAPLDLSRIRAAAGDLDAMRRADPGIASARVVVEPGRYLVGAAGVYIARVTATKVSRGRRFAITDGGMHHHLAASGNLGQVIKRDYPVVAANRMDEPAEGALTVVGPLCTPLDVLARQGALPDLRPGDLVAVLQSGAYGLTASPVGFLSHDTPAEVLVEDGRHRMIRRRARADAVFD